MFKSDVEHLRNSLELAVGLDELVVRERLWKHWGAVPARCRYGAPYLQVLLDVWGSEKRRAHGRTVYRRVPDSPKKRRGRSGILSVTLGIESSNESCRRSALLRMMLMAVEVHGL